MTTVKLTRIYNYLNVYVVDINQEILINLSTPKDKLYKGQNKTKKTPQEIYWNNLKFI